MRGLQDRRVVVTGGALRHRGGDGFTFPGRGCVRLHPGQGRNGQRPDLPFAARAGGNADLATCPAWSRFARAFEEAERRIGFVDTVINNAGISIRHRFLDITAEEWNRVLAVNLTGVFLRRPTAARRMVEKDGGVILNTASTNGIMGYPHYADYNASKAGVIELSRIDGARAGAACPGERRRARLCPYSHAAGRVHRRDAGRGQSQDPARPATRALRKWPPSSPFWPQTTPPTLPGMSSRSTEARSPEGWPAGDAPRGNFHS